VASNPSPPRLEMPIALGEEFDADISYAKQTGHVINVPEAYNH